MSVATELYDRLLADAGVSAILGTRVYPDVLPQKVTYPAIRYQRIDTPRLRNHAGDADQASPRFQIDCYALTRIEAEALAAAVRSALTSQNIFWGAIKIRFAYVENEAGAYEKDVEPEVYNQRLDFIIAHTEP